MPPFLFFSFPLWCSLWIDYVQSKIGIEVYVEWSERIKQLIFSIIHFTNI